VNLGDADTDVVTFKSTIKSSHTSDTLIIDDTAHITQDLTVDKTTTLKDNVTIEKDITVAGTYF
jgi:acyl-[acyl carrier protein]--UDP-N-acetylglucosamine O-acyltransferase